MGGGRDGVWGRGAGCGKWKEREGTIWSDLWLYGVISKERSSISIEVDLGNMKKPIHIGEIRMEAK